VCVCMLGVIFLRLIQLIAIHEFELGALYGEKSHTGETVLKNFQVTNNSCLRTLHGLINCDSQFV
jgi:hypothetical protein